MPSRRRNRKSVVSQEAKQETSKKKLYFGLIVFVLFFMFFGFWYWVSGAFQSIVIARYLKSGDGEIVVINKDEDRYASFLVPKNTLLNLSSQRGEWQMQSLWPLIKSESLTKSMLSSTFMKSFHLPIFNWMVYDGETSLTFREKLLYQYYSHFKQKTDEIDLSDTNFLIKSKLSDGDQGYLISENVPNSIKQYFIPPQLPDNGINVNIINSSSLPRYSLNDLVDVLENYGIHVISVRNADSSVDNCTVKTAEKSEVFSDLAKYFGCSQEKNPTGSIDAEITIGDKFLKSF